VPCFFTENRQNPEGDIMCCSEKHFGIWLSKLTCRLFQFLLSMLFQYIVLLLRSQRCLNYVSCLYKLLLSIDLAE